MKIESEEGRTNPCPLCGVQLVCTDGKIPNHGRRMGVGIMPCDATANSVGFARQWAKEASKEGKKK